MIKFSTLGKGKATELKDMSDWPKIIKFLMGMTTFLEK